ncbi:MAG: type II toxin-antitoxin system HigA family antitoxin [Candidatus Cryptobacteroides sp.]
MRQITESQYQLALRRVEELLPVVGEDMSPDDPKAVELAIMSDIVIDYEESHYPIEKPTVAELIRDGLKEMNLTQKDLAKELGVSTTRVNDFTTGRAEPSLLLAGSICRILKISPVAMMRM